MRRRLSVNERGVKGAPRSWSSRTCRTNSPTRCTNSWAVHCTPRHPSAARTPGWKANRPRACAGVSYSLGRGVGGSVDRTSARIGFVVEAFDAGAKGWRVGRLEFDRQPRTARAAPGGHEAAVDVHVDRLAAAQQTTLHRVRRGARRFTPRLTNGGAAHLFRDYLRRRSAACGCGGLTGRIDPLSSSRSPVNAWRSSDNAPRWSRTHRRSSLL